MSTVTTATPTGGTGPMACERAPCTTEVPMVDLGERAKIMSGLFGVRETVTHVPARLRVQLFDPLVRDANGSRDRRQIEDAGQPVHKYHHAQHRESRQFDGILADGTLIKAPGADNDAEEEPDDDDGWHDEGQRRERTPPADTLLLLNGVDGEGRTVCVSVKGMRYVIYVLCPAAWTIVHMQALAATIEGYYGIHRGGVTYQQMPLHHMLGWEPETNDLTRTKRHNYCVLGFGSARVMEWAANAIDGREAKLCRRLREPLNEKDMRSLQVYERRVDPVHKALERLGGLQPCSWFDVGRWHKPDLYHTHAQIEVEAYVRDIVPRPEIDVMAPVWKASWDVECYSRDGSFPRADHPRGCDHTICINTYFSQHRSDGRPPRVIQTSHHFGAVRVHRPVDAERDRVDDPRQRERWGVLEMDRDGTDPMATEALDAQQQQHQRQARSHHEVYVMQCATELEAIEGWRDLIVLDVQPSVVEGYNTDAFDFGWLGVRAERCARYGVRSRLFEAGVLIGEHTPMRRKDLDSAAKGSNTLNFIPMPGRILVDMYHIVKAEKRLESYTLDDVCRSIFPKDESLRKIDVPPEEIFDHYASGDLDRRAVVVEYCARDCRLPLALEEHLMTLTGVVEMARITRTPLPLMLISGQQVKTWSQIVYEAHTMGYVVNAPEGRDRGGGGTRDWLRGAYGVGDHGVGDQWLPGVIAMASIRAGGGNADGHQMPQDGGKVAGGPEAADAEGYTGATVLQPRAGYYDVPIVTLDYQSLYPSIMEANNLCPSTRVTSPPIHKELVRHCREVREPASEVLRADGAGQDASALNRVFASRRDWLPGQFAVDTDRPGIQRTVAYREVTPATGRTHVFVQHVQGVVPRILTALKNQRKRVRADQKAYEKGTALWGVYENRQLGIKITANSVYGFLGAVKRGRMPCVEVSESVTCIGRDMINATKAYVETHLSRYVGGLLDDPALVAAAAERKRAKERLDADHANDDHSAVTPPPPKDDRSDREKNRDALLDALAAAGISPCDITGATVVYGDTDSVMIKFHGVPKTREGVEVALQLGVAASDYITTKFPDQIILDTEKAYWPYVLFRKKRYAGRMWTLDGKPPYIDAKGVEVKRRDNWAGLRKTYKACLEAMMERMDIDAVKDIVLRLVCDLKGDRVSLDDYKISKSLKRDYSKCKSPPPHVVVRDKIARRNPGSEPLAGNRVYFVITVDDRLKKKSARAEDPAYVAANPRLARIDRLYYLDSLKNPFGALLEPCFDNPEQLFADAAVFIANQQKGQAPITQWMGGKRAAVPTTEADVEAAEARERALIAARVKRRCNDQTYVPAAVLKQQKTEARKIARKAPPPKSGPLTAFVKKRPAA
ncbi:DNA polymerase type-B [Pandoravirus quercus]|uniref:DNA polymerase n=2 Tax=Pandoravirus TaxID=2060084 RepID=A0A2U7U8B1_9VIRU|nr:DNA polymerase type-B [Pandoravirus quercus]AVK74688.1 DNA polymerase type-B [Pandoravirus quercus]QBZ80865.1 DNA polymerase type-B incomplete domain containing protein [Pandoravirus celtis]